MINIIIFAGLLFGICLGSFAKVLADRSLRKKSFSGRSYCESCQHSLSWYDLFPVLSYISVGGKCRYCHKQLSKEYFMVELITGVLVSYLWFMTFPYYSGLWEDPIKTGFFLLDVGSKTFFITILVTLFITDIRKMFIPDRVVIPSIKIGFGLVVLLLISKIAYLYYSLVTSYIGQFLLPPFSNYFYSHTYDYINQFLWSVLMFLLIGGFFLFLIIVTRGKGMGGGDVKLGAFIGLMLGYPASLLAIVLSFFIGAVFSIFLILGGKKRFGQVIPFGPFMVIASLIALFWGNQIIEWYLHLSI